MMLVELKIQRINGLYALPFKLLYSMVIMKSFLLSFPKLKIFFISTGFHYELYKGEGKRTSLA